MSDPVSPSDVETPGEPPRSRPAAAAKKKKSKVRNAWIAFVGRIVAQVVGAVASIVLAAEVDPMFDGLRADARFAPLARGGR